MTYRCAWDGRMPCLWPEKCAAEERCGRYGVILVPDMPLALRAALVKQLEDASFAYGRSAIRDANVVVDAIEELLTLHPDAEAHRTLAAWWLRQFDEQGIDPCFCIYHAETGERTDNPHCPRHRVRPVVDPALIDGSPDA